MRLFTVPVLLSAFLLAGCGSRTGDFGRPVDTEAARFGNSFLGNAFAEGRSEPVSDFKFTDDEVELRDRAWRFLMPETARGTFDQVLAEWRIKRYLPPDTTLEKRAYFWTLDGESRVSPASRYSTLAADIEADLLLVRPFRVIAAKVMEADRVRLGMLYALTDAEPEEARNVDDRIAENILLMDWVYRSWRQRHRDYKYALERLVISTPMHQAIPAERLLRQFEAEISAIDPGDISAERDRVLKGGSSYPSKAVVK